MKFLDYPELEQLSRQLTFDSAECRVFTRLEAYSCKPVNRDKKLLKALESTYGHAASSTSPPSVLEEHLASPFGKLDQPAARKTLWLLIATLNGAFPDHDFAQANPADFKRERSVDYVINSLSSTLVSLRSGSAGSFSLLPSTSYEEGAAALSPSGSYGSPPTHLGSHRVQGDAALGAILEDILCVSECEVFTYSPDMDSDPHAYPDPDEGYMDGEDDTWAEDNYSLFDSGAQSLADDAPMFDEDMDGGALGQAAAHSTSFNTSGGGLLWSTYVFFYNRKLKRILFVEVWARR
ncbi:Maf1 regulator, partial [Ceraceosorus guamensis]